MFSIRHPVPSSKRFASVFFLFASCLNGSVQIIKRGGDPALTLFFSCFYNVVKWFLNDTLYKAYFCDRYSILPLSLRLSNITGILA